MNFQQIILTLCVFAIPFLFAVTLHEAAGGYAARRLGDPTPGEAGRLSLNPARHIDAFGTIVLPLLTFISLQIPVGYAKRMPYDFSRLRKPKEHMGLIALAGPMANFLMGLTWMALGAVMIAIGTQEKFFLEVARAGVTVNAAIFVLNMIPLPPMAGGRILIAVLPLPMARWVAQIERYGMYVALALLALLYLRVLDGLLIKAMDLVFKAYYILLAPLTILLS